MSGAQCQHKVPVPGTRQFRWCGVTDNVADVPGVGPRCPQHTAPKRARSETPQRVRAIISAQKLTLDDDERHELAAMLVGHEGSWSRISEKDAARVADALEGFLIIQALLKLRRDARGGS